MCVRDPSGPQGLAGPPFPGVAAEGEGGVHRKWSATRAVAGPEFVYPDIDPPPSPMPLTAREYVFCLLLRAPPHGTGAPWAACARGERGRAPAVVWPGGRRGFIGPSRGHAPKKGLRCLRGATARSPSQPTTAPPKVPLHCCAAFPWHISM